MARSPAGAPPAGDRLHRGVDDFPFTGFHSRPGTARLHRQGSLLPPHPGTRRDHGDLQERIPLAGIRAGRGRRDDRAARCADRLGPARGAPAVLERTGRIQPVGPSCYRRMSLKPQLSAELQRYRRLLQRLPLRPQQALDTLTCR